MTQQVSHRPIKCQSRSWSQRGTKVNGSHHGDNPLLRPTGIQIATKSPAALQEMAPTNVKTVHQTSLLHNIESKLDRLELLSPTHGQRSQQPGGQIILQSVLINKLKFLKAAHRTEISKINTEVHGSGGLELVKPARERASSRPKPCESLKSPTNLVRSPLPVTLVGRKQTVVRNRLCPQKPPGSRL